VKVLVVAAHPDDEVLGCGGTIARLAQEGHQVYIAILGEGITSRYKQREAVDQVLLDTLHDTSNKVAKCLSAEELYTFNLPDNRFDSVPLLEVIKLIEGLLERLQPQVIYTHHAGDLNIDHQIINRAVLTATRPIQGQKVQEIYAFEIPSSTEWAFQNFTPIFRPNVFVDISSTIEIKIEAMEYYESEARVFPHPRSPEALRSIACRWGSVVGCRAVEAFELIRAVRGL